METIGGRVRAARDRRVWSQDELARATGMPKASISRIETGKTIPRRSSIRKLAEALGVDPVWVLFGDGADQIGPVGKAAA